MKIMTGLELAEACRGQIVQGNPELPISGFQIDSRQVREGDFFVPLKGEHADGHQYIPHALERGACGTFFARPELPPLPGQALVIRVDDVLAALQQAAAAHRARFKLPVIGVTGSSGKTTAKDFIAGVLASRMEVLKTSGNLNNEIGLPLTLLALQERHQVAVLEMGMSAPGEITALARIARPVIGVITNIGEAHMELLGSREAIARAKGELLEQIGAAGIAVLNGDDGRLLEMGKRFPGKVYYYGFGRGDIKCLELSQQGERSFFRVRFPDNQEEDFELPLPGRHLISNALAALAVGYIFRLTPAQMREGLGRSEITGGRLQIKEAPGGFKVIDDSYNANPSSVKAALEVLRELGGAKGVAVLGDMLELGSLEKEAHAAVGRHAAGCGIAALVTVGERAREAAVAAREAGLKAFACAEHAEALALLQKMPLAQGWYVLVKGSRGARMEKLVEALMEQ